MKTTKIFLVLLMMTAGVFTSTAQTKTKIGVINIGELLEVMPAYDSVMVAYQAKYDQMQRDLQQLYAEFQTKKEEYVRMQDSLTELMKSIKMQDLDGLQNRIQTLQDGAQDELNRFVEEAQAPIMKRIREAIKEVAKENGYTHILNNSQDQVLYYGETFDILPLVKAKLGLKDMPVPVQGK